MPMKPPKDKVCPFHKKPMSKVCEACPFWTKFTARDDKGNVDVDFDCGLAALSPQMLGLQQGLRGCQSATESFRNEMVTISKAPVVIEAPRLEKK